MLHPPPEAVETGSLKTLHGTTNWRWSIVGLLFLATVLNYLDRQTIAITGPLIQEEFNLNNEQYGQLLSAFRWAYGALHVPAGYIVDRFSVRWFYALAVTIWSMAGAAAFFVPSARALYGTRIALGLGEAFNWPCALRTTANILPRQDRGLGNGIFNSGAAIGALVAPLIIGSIANSYGWRPTFLVVGGAGLVWVALWLLMTGPAHSAKSVETPESARVANREPFLVELGKILANPGFWILLVGASTINPCWYFITEWSAKYFNHQYQLRVDHAAYVTIAIFVLADFGNIGGGGMVKYLVGRGRSVRDARAVTVLLGAALPLAAILVNHVDNRFVAVAFLAVAAYGITSLMTNLLACYQEISFASVGLVMGLLGGSGCVTGAIVNPYIGRYIDQTGNYHLLFILLGIVPSLTLASIVLFDRINKTADVDS